MSVFELLSRLRSERVHLWVEGSALRYAAPKPGLAEAQRRELESRRDEIVAFLRRAAPVEAKPAPRVRAGRRDDDPPLTFEQRRLWVLSRMAPRSSAYNIPGIFRLRGALSVAALEQALEAIVRRHDALRSTVGGRDEEPVLRVDRAVRASLPVVVLEHLDAGARDAARRALAAREASRPFDLRAGPLLRCCLLHAGAADHTLLLTVHHLVFDRSSLQVFARELRELYAACLGGAPARLPDPPVQFAEVAWLQHERAQDGAFTEDLAWWERELRGVPPVTSLPVDRPRAGGTAAPAAEVAAAIPPALLRAVKDAGARRGCTLPVTLLATFLVLLHRYSGQDDLCVGLPVAERDDPRLDGTIGFLVHTLPVRHDLSGDPSFGALLDRVRDACNAAYARRDVPSQLVLDRLKMPRSASHAPVFQVVVAFQAESGTRFDVAGLRVDVEDLPAATSAKFDLLLFLTEGGDGLTASFQYNADLFDAATIRRMADHYGALLAAIVDAPGGRISRLPWPDDVQGADGGGRDVRTEPQDTTLRDLVARQAARAPDAVAVLAPGVDGAPEALTYGGLGARARAAAAGLRARGIGPERRVGVCLDASLARPIVLLAILEAGGAYVPLDPRWPEQRLAFAIADAELSLVVADAAYAARLRQAGATCVLASELDSIGRSPASAGPEPSAVGSNLAYVLYTSGSTGPPKGIAIEHRSSVAFVGWATRYFEPAELACVYASTPLCFDLSVFELFATWCGGGTVVVADSILQLPEAADAAPVTLVNTVPSAADALARSADLPRSIRTVNLAGEALHRRTVDLLFERDSIRRVVNLYGPTEATTYSTAATLARGDETAPPLGQAVDGTAIYVCDPALRRMARGAVGELVIGGAGLARGYVNRPDLTAECFVPDPFSPAPGARMYRTGDLARYAADGALRFVGRRDQQVKLRGHRIELGEVEAALHDCGGVAAAAASVVPAAAGDRLAAFVVARDGRRDEPGLRRELAERLPDYMLPEEIVWLDALPRTTTGKIDRQALHAAPRGEARVRRPAGHLERAIAEVWRGVLHEGVVDVDRPFFEMGGNSLHLLQVAARLRDRLGRELPVVDLLRYPSVRSLAQHLSANGGAAGVEARQAGRRGSRRAAALSGVMRDVNERRRGHA